MNAFIDEPYVSKDDVPDRPEWMRPVDVDILRLLEQSKVYRIQGLWTSPMGIAVNLERTNDYITRRMRVLLDHGLVERHHEHILYRISDKGSGWINGRIPTDEL